MDYVARRKKVYDWMSREGITLAVFEDFERCRDQSVRYLCGQPGDALLFLAVSDDASGSALLVPWDDAMANVHASVDDMIPYTHFELDPFLAVKAAATFFHCDYGGKIEIPDTTSYPSFLKYVETLSSFDVICRNDGVRALVDELRSVKDSDEQMLYRLCAQKTNEIIALIENHVSDGTLKTETDVALFIEAECRKRDCDGTGFTTLAAGAKRSFGIHCFPPYTGGFFGEKGLSILDFGIVYQGYTSDVTLTFARDPDKAQKKRLTLVEEAFDRAFSMVCEAFADPNGQNSLAGRSVAQMVDTLFKKHGVYMPHGLGHGIGLEAHEAPYLRRAASNRWEIKPGAVFTIEPGIYDPVVGGCRLENDILIGEHGAEILTKSKVIMLS